MLLNAVTAPDAAPPAPHDSLVVQAMTSRLDALNQWVLQVARLTQPTTPGVP